MKNKTKTEKSVKFTTHACSLIKRLRLNHRTIDCSFPRQLATLLKACLVQFHLHYVPLLAKKITKHTKRQKIQFEEIEQAPEPDTVMAGILKLSGHKCKSTMANMPRILNGKVGNMQENIGNVSGVMEILKKNKI